MTTTFIASQKVVDSINVERARNVRIILLKVFNNNYESTITLFARLELSSFHSIITTFVKIIIDQKSFLVKIYQITHVAKRAKSNECREY